MKKIICIMMSAMIFTLSGCIRSITHSIDPDSEALKLADEVINLFIEKDSEGLKDMFCTTIAESRGFDEDLDIAINYIEGEVTSYKCTLGGSQESVRSGEQTLVKVSPHIEDIVTSSGKSYEIIVNSRLVDVENPEYAGIVTIYIECSDGESFRLGNYELVSSK